MVLAQHPPYLMSFGTGGLHINESVAVARLRLEGNSWKATAAKALETKAFPVRKVSSARRSIREIINRLRQLSDDELLLLVEGDRPEQAALLWLAACRAYRFIREFAVEVLNERFLSLRLHVTYDDFDSFLAAKAEWSPKLASLTNSTRAKLRAVLFRLMREAERAISGRPASGGNAVAQDDGVGSRVTLRNFGFYRVLNDTLEGRMARTYKTLPPESVSTISCR